ncbi:YHS domain protein [Rhodocytophaga rosea]|uniref:YHS domain protein n=1 Tax=Rhodocytophaga rosea TaxID=2704465 RepID=A0A6C0GWU9_9BACT|nr:YHS domain-containing (seleno)protein [Rhodocytophaga rosea]QHT71780.1 YHS domain protein [Rhodocytophaga rosea]
MKNLLVLLTTLTAVAGIFHQAWAQNEGSRRLKHYNLEQTLAIGGYDPVAYFTQNKALEGKKSNTYTYQNVTYYFASPTNLESFKKEPARYEPQYGGWCAYAMGETGEKVEIDPETFKILDGKLYLFYNKLFTNTLPKWNKDEANLKKKADISWAKLYQ